MTKILITVRKGIKGPNVTRVRRRLVRILKRLGSPKGELSILFTDDTEMKQLNSKFRRVAKTTDVLSFPADAEDESPGPIALGDIALSVPTARRQAKKMGASLEKESLHLLVHGLLHILGYDHEKSAKKKKEMEKMQEKLMAAGYARK